MTDLLTDAQFDQLKTTYDVEPPLGPVLQRSLVLGAADESECQSFHFDIKVFKVDGKFCKSGSVELKAYVGGIKVGDTTINVSKEEVCQDPSIGHAFSLQYCFYLKSGDCLYTKGYIKDWWHDDASWDEKLLCL